MQGSRTDGEERHLRHFQRPIVTLRQLNQTLRTVGVLVCVSLLVFVFAQALLVLCNALQDRSLSVFGHC